LVDPAVILPSVISGDIKPVAHATTFASTEPVQPQPELKDGDKVRLEPKEDFKGYKVAGYWNKYLNTKFRIVSLTTDWQPGIASVIDELDTIRYFPLCWLRLVKDGEDEG
jgi:hypothetical protein